MSDSKQALIPLLNRLYTEIREIEAEHGLWAGKDDYRPRIEYFHDAVRAYSSGVSPYEPKTRLSLERLSYDIDNLRKIQMNPLESLKKTMRYASGTEVAVKKADPKKDSYRSRRMIRGELSDRYRQYGVMFAALLAETADMNFNARAEERDFLVEELEQIKLKIEGMSAIDLRQLASQMVDDPELAALISESLPEGVLHSKQAKDHIRHLQGRIDHQKERLEQAHITWLSCQRMMYEDGKDVVTQLQRHGMQMAGKFLEDAIARTGPSMGSGRGF
jgi:hypothetical protein